MTAAVLRPAREEEIREAAHLFITSVTDLAARNGLAAPLYTMASIEPVYRHIHRTGIFEVAELDGQMVAICHAIVRDHQWFLSGFWALPGFQKKGLGGPLLARVREQGEARGARLRFTWSSVDLTAMATYMKQGMLPGFQILTFAGSPTSLPEPDPSFEEGPLDPALAGDLDLRIRGVRREVDHTFWQTNPLAGRLVVKNGRAVGYHYASGGMIGPVGWLGAEDGAGVFAVARRAARQGAESIRVPIPGKNHVAVRAALGAGLRLVAFSHILCTEEPGAMDRYIPSGPSLF